MGHCSKCPEWIWSLIIAIVTFITVLIVIKKLIKAFTDETIEIN